MEDRNNIKYFQQETSYSCGPACLRMILSMFKMEIKEEVLVDLCGTTLFGTTCEQIKNAAIQLGFEAETFKGISKTNILKLLNEKSPLIALLDASELYGGIPVGHFVAILGVDKSQIVYHDPVMGENLTIDISNFLNAWEVCKFRGVRIWK